MKTKLFIREFIMKNILRFIGEGGILMTALFLLACPTDPTSQPDPIKLTLTGTSKANLGTEHELKGKLLRLEGGIVSDNVAATGIFDSANTVIFNAAAGDYGVSLSKVNKTTKDEVEEWWYLIPDTPAETGYNFKAGDNSLNWKNFTDKKEDLPPLQTKLTLTGTSKAKLQPPYVLAGALLVYDPFDLDADPEVIATNMFDGNTVSFFEANADGTPNFGQRFTGTGEYGIGLSVINPLDLEEEGDQWVYLIRETLTLTMTHNFTRGTNTLSWDNFINPNDPIEIPPKTIQLTLEGTSKAPLQYGEVVAMLVSYNVLGIVPVATGMILPGSTVFTFFDLDSIDENIILDILTGGNIPEEAFFTKAGNYGVILDSTSEEEPQSWIYKNTTFNFKQGMNTLSWDDFEGSSF